MEKLDEDTVALLSRRAYDVAASTRGVKVFLNGKRIPVKVIWKVQMLDYKVRLTSLAGHFIITVRQPPAVWEIVDLLRLILIKLSFPAELLFLEESGVLHLIEGPS